MSEWRVRESARLTPESGIAASWSVRSTREPGQEVWTRVDVVADVMERLATGSVADETRQSLSTQGRRAVEIIVKAGGDPPELIVCSASGCEAR
jgi:hypothetical protein